MPIHWWPGIVRSQLTNGLVYALNFQEGTGTALFDRSGYHGRCSFSSALVGAWAIAPGRENYLGARHCMESTGSGIRRLTTNLGGNPSAEKGRGGLFDFTCVVIFQPRSGGNSFARLVDKNEATGFWMGRDGTTDDRYGGGVLEGSSPFGRYLDGFTFNTEEWHMLASRRQGDQHTISRYSSVGTVQEDHITGTVSAAQLNTDRATLLMAANNSKRFDGFMAAFYVWDQVKTDGELKDIWEDWYGMFRRPQKVIAVEAVVEDIIISPPAVVRVRMLVPDITIDVPRTITPTPAGMTLKINPPVVLVPRTVSPDAAILNLNLPDAAVNRQIRPDAAVLTLVVPAHAAVGVDIIAPDAAVLSLVVPDHKVNRLVQPDAAVLTLNLPAITIMETVKPDPAILNLNVPAHARVGVEIVNPDATVLTLAVPTHKVNRLIVPDAAVLTLNAPDITIMETVKLDPAILNLNVPAHRVERVIDPTPAVLNLVVPDVKANRLIQPDAAILSLVVPDHKVNRQLRPDPVVLTLNVQDITIMETVKPDPAILNLNVPAPAVNRVFRPDPVVLTLNVQAAAVVRANITPDPVVLTLNVQDIRVNRLVRPDAAVLSLNAQVIQVNATIAPDPATLNLQVATHAVDRIIGPAPATLNLAVPAAAVLRTLIPDPAVLSLVIPAHAVDRIIGPDPATLNLQVATHAVDRVIDPDPTVLNLNVPDHKVNRRILPTPVVLTLNVPTAKVNRLIQPAPALLTLVVPVVVVEAGVKVFPDPAILSLQAQAINRVGGISMPPFIVQIDEDSPTARFNGTNTMVVFAASSADARAIAKAKFGGDADPAWNDAQVTEVVQATDAEGFRLRVAILDSSPVVDLSVTGGPLDQIDDLGQAMAVLLNLEPIIGGAVYTTGTNVLIVAAGSGADDLGDRDLVVELLAPSSNVAIPGGVVSVTDQGASTDDLSATLAADDFLIPDVHMTAKRSGTD